MSAVTVKYNQAQSHFQLLDQILTCMHHRCAFCTLWEGGGVRELYGWAERFTESSEENQRGKILFCQCREETRNNWFLDVMQSSHMWKQAQWWLLGIHVQEYYEIRKGCILGLILTSLKKFRELIMIHMYQS